MRDTMTDHPNAELLRRLYAGDRQALYDRLAPDYVVHVPGTGPVAGSYAGAAGHAEHVRAMGLWAGDTLSKSLSGSFLADDHWGLVPSELEVERDGRRLRVRGFGIWRFRDGDVTEHWGLVDHQTALDDFLA
jgi:ketosteroid isomerase-like protein